MSFLKCKRKKFGPIFKELLKFLPKKISICSQIYGFGIWEKSIPDPGSKGQKGTGSRIRIRNTGKKLRISDQQKLLNTRTVWQLLRYSGVNLFGTRYECECFYKVLLCGERRHGSLIIFVYNPRNVLLINPRAGW
jgi:hypothetical protein